MKEIGSAITTVGTLAVGAWLFGTGSDGVQVGGFMILALGAFRAFIQMLAAGGK